MKVKKIIFTLLIGASLGFAHSVNASPSHTRPAHSASNTTTPDTSTSANTTLATSTAASPDASPASIAALQSAVQGSGISPDCAAALLSIATSPEFTKCVPLPALLAFAPLADPSLIKNFLADPAKGYPPIEKPLIAGASLLCPAPKCSDQGVAGAIKTIQDKCKADLDAKNPFIELVLTATVLYSPLRDSLCFKDKDKFCWDESILTAIGLPKSPIKIIGQAVLDAVAVADPPVICTTCNKQIYNTFANFLKNNDLAKQLLAGFGIDDKVLNQIVLFFAVKCGIKFEDGQVPKQ